MRAEDQIFEEWQRARKLRDASRGAKGQAYYAMADALQHLLEDHGAYGRSLVFQPRPSGGARDAGARRMRRDVPSHLTIKGRRYAVSTRESTRGTVYNLTGARGASYFLMRHAREPHLLFVVPHDMAASTLEGVWLTDEGGTLRVLERGSTRDREVT